MKNDRRDQELMKVSGQPLFKQENWLSAFLLVCTVFLSACATGRKPESTPLPAAVLRAEAGQPTSAPRSVPPTVVSSVSPSVAPAPSPSAVAEKPIPRDTPSSALGKLLPRSCAILESTPTMLLVKRSGTTGSPSLFEEAIALGKLRGILTSKPAIPKGTAQKTRLQNGTATIPFGKGVPPAETANIIVAALSVDGIQKVRAELDAD